MATPTFKTTFHPLSGKPITVAFWDGPAGSGVMITQDADHRGLVSMPGEPELLVDLGETLIQIAGWIAGAEEDLV